MAHKYGTKAQKTAVKKQMKQGKTHAQASKAVYKKPKKKGY